MNTRRVRLLALALAGTFAVAHDALRPVTPPATGAVLEVVVDSVKDGTAADEVAEAARTLRNAVERFDGFDWATDARFATKSGERVLRARIWKSVEAAEAASLALDGSDSEGAVAKLAGNAGRQTWHFRELRRHDYREDRAGHLEVVVFRTKAGTTREQNLERFDAAEADFKTGEGLHGHSLWLAPDGRWVHLLRWKDEAAYGKTGKALFRSKVGSWIRSLDFRRFTVLRGDTF